MRIGKKPLTISILLFLAAAPFSFAQEKPRVAVLDFETGGASRADLGVVAEKIRKVFALSERYTVAGRNVSEKIVQEWATKQSGQTDEERILKTGRMYNVHAIVSGKLIKLPDGGWRLSAVLLDAQTGKPARAETVHYQGELLELVDQKLPRLVLALAGVVETGAPTALPGPPPTGNREATALYRSARRGDATAQFKLGLMYDEGDRAIREDNAVAIIWYQLAAEEGNTGAQFNLGLMYDQGEKGVPEDNIKAIHWYRMAAANGDPGAQFNLGLMYDMGGKGIPEDNLEAAKWYKMAAEQGNNDARINLAIINGGN